MPRYASCPNCSSIDFWSREVRSLGYSMRYEVEDDHEGDLIVNRDEVEEKDLIDRTVFYVNCANCGQEVEDPEETVERHDKQPEEPGYHKIWAVMT